MKASFDVNSILREEDDDLGNQRAEQCMMNSQYYQETEQMYLFKNGTKMGFAFYILFLVVIFCVPIGVLWTRRNTFEMQPRSPYMILISLVYLMFDVIGNTCLFSIDPSNNNLSVCYTGVIITVIC